MISRDRSDYSAIVDGPPLKLPGRRLVTLPYTVEYNAQNLKPGSKT